MSTYLGVVVGEARDSLIRAVGQVINLLLASEAVMREVIQDLHSLWDFIDGRS